MNRNFMNLFRSNNIIMMAESWGPTTNVQDTLKRLANIRDILVNSTAGQSVRSTGGHAMAYDQIGLLIESTITSINDIRSIIVDGNDLEQFEQSIARIDQLINSHNQENPRNIFRQIGENTNLPSNLQYTRISEPTTQSRRHNPTATTPPQRLSGKEQIQQRINGLEKEFDNNRTAFQNLEADIETALKNGKARDFTQRIATQKQLMTDLFNQAKQIGVDMGKLDKQVAKGDLTLDYQRILIRGQQRIMRLEYAENNLRQQQEIDRLTTELDKHSQGTALHNTAQQEINDALARIQSNKAKSPSNPLPTLEQLEQKINGDSKAIKDLDLENLLNVYKEYYQQNKNIQEMDNGSSKKNHLAMKYFQKVKELEGAIKSAVLQKYVDIMHGRNQGLLEGLGKVDGEINNLSRKVEENRSALETQNKIVSSIDVDNINKDTIAATLDSIRDTREALDNIEKRIGRLQDEQHRIQEQLNDTKKQLSLQDNNQEVQALQNRLNTINIELKNQQTDLNRTLKSLVDKRQTIANGVTNGRIPLDLIPANHRGMADIGQATIQAQGIDTEIRRFTTQITTLEEFVNKDKQAIQQIIEEDNIQTVQITPQMNIQDLAKASRDIARLQGRIESLFGATNSQGSIKINENKRNEINEELTEALKQGNILHTRANSKEVKGLQNRLNAIDRELKLQRTDLARAQEALKAKAIEITTAVGAVIIDPSQPLPAGITQEDATIIKNRLIEKFTAQVETLKAAVQTNGEEIEGINTGIEVANTNNNVNYKEIPNLQREIDEQIVKVQELQQKQQRIQTELQTAIQQGNILHSRANSKEVKVLQDNLVQINEQLQRQTQDLTTVQENLNAKKAELIANITNGTATIDNPDAVELDPNDITDPDMKNAVIARSIAVAQAIDEFINQINDLEADVSRNGESITQISNQAEQIQTTGINVADLAAASGDIIRLQDNIDTQLTEITRLENEKQRIQTDLGQAKNNILRDANINGLQDRLDVIDHQLREQRTALITTRETLITKTNELGATVVARIQSGVINPNDPMHPLPQEITGLPGVADAIGTRTQEIQELVQGFNRDIDGLKDEVNQNKDTVERITQKVNDIDTTEINDTNVKEALEQITTSYNDIQDAKEEVIRLYGEQKDIVDQLNNPNIILSKQTIDGFKDRLTEIRTDLDRQVQIIDGAEQSLIDKVARGISNDKILPSELEKLPRELIDSDKIQSAITKKQNQTFDRIEGSITELKTAVDNNSKAIEKIDEEIDKISPGAIETIKDANSVLEEIGKRKAELEQVKTQLQKSTEKVDTILKDINTAKKDGMLATSNLFYAFQSVLDTLEQSNKAIKAAEQKLTLVEKAVQNKRESLELLDQKRTELMENLSERIEGLDSKIHQDTINFNKEVANKINTLLDHTNGLPTNKNNAIAIRELQQGLERLLGEKDDFDTSIKTRKDRIREFTDIKQGIQNTLNNEKNGLLEGLDVSKLEDNLKKIEDNLDLQDREVNTLAQRFGSRIDALQQDLSRRQAVVKQKFNDGIAKLSEGVKVTGEVIAGTINEAKQLLDERDFSNKDLRELHNLRDKIIRELNEKIENQSQKVKEFEELKTTIQNDLNLAKNGTLKDFEVRDLETTLNSVKTLLNEQRNNLTTLQTQLRGKYKEITAEISNKTRNLDQTPEPRKENPFKESRYGMSEQERELRDKLIKKGAILIDKNEDGKLTKLNSAEKESIQIQNYVGGDSATLHILGNNAHQLKIQFNKVAEIANKGKPFTTIATFEEYKGQSVEHKVTYEGDKKTQKSEVKITGENMVFNIEKDFGSKLKKMANVVTRSENPPRPQVYLENGKPVLQVNSKEEAQAVKKEMQHTKINGIEFTALEVKVRIREEEQSLSASTSVTTDDRSPQELLRQSSINPNLFSGIEEEPTNRPEFERSRSFAGRLETQRSQSPTPGSTP